MLNIRHVTIHLLKSILTLTIRAPNHACKHQLYLRVSINRATYVQMLMLRLMVRTTTQKKRETIRMRKSKRHNKGQTLSKFSRDNRRQRLWAGGVWIVTSPFNDPWRRASYRTGQRASQHGSLPALAASEPRCSCRRRRRRFPCRRR